MTTAARSRRKAAPSSIDATTLPPGEFMKMRNRCDCGACRAKSTKACGVSASMTPSATTTCGQLAPQSFESKLTERKVIVPCSAAAGEAASSQTHAAAAQKTDSAAQPRTNALSGLVGGDGLEPPTLSV